MSIGNEAALTVLQTKRLLMCLGTLVLSIGSAHAQIGDTLLLPALIPNGFNRGHNQSVTELPRPGFEPVGIRIRSFTLLPSIQSGLGATSNTYYTVEPVASAFTSNTPSAQLVSRWNRHQLSFSASGTFRNYLGQSRRNEKNWQADSSGRIDIGRFSSVTIEEVSSLMNENQFTGETTPTFAALSRYRRDYLSIRGVNQIGRSRITVATDRASFRYLPLPLLTGESRSQSNRDRNIERATVQYEYARGPDLAFFLQASYADQAYDEPLSSTIPNLDSHSVRFLSGFNFDDPGFARGTLGLGYTHQDFKSAIYKPVGGLSVEARLELFPTRLTTVAINGRRTIEVTNLTARGAYWDNRVSMRIDREIWRRIIFSVQGEYSKQSYTNPQTSATSYQVTTSGQYFSSRNRIFNLSLNYGRRGAASNVIGNGFAEIRGEGGVTFRI